MTAPTDDDQIEGSGAPMAEELHDGDPGGTGTGRGGRGGGGGGDGGGPGEDDATQPLIDPRIRARRIEVRRHAGRRRLRRFELIGAALGVVLLAILVLHSPLLDVDRVEVVGAAQSGRALVVQTSGVRPGARMVGVPLGTVAKRIRTLPWVARVTVRRSWPGTVRIAITERVPVAAVPATGGGFVLVDAAGWEAGVVLAVPPRIARLDVDPIPPHLNSQAPARLDGLVEVAASVPSEAWDRVASLRAVAPPLPVTTPATTTVAAGSSPGSTTTVAGQDATSTTTGAPTSSVPTTVAGTPTGAAPAVEVDVVLRLPGGASATAHLGPPDQLARKWLALLTVLDQVDLRGVSTIDVRVPASPAIIRG